MIKKTVGFIALANTKENGLVAALQVRGNFNIEKNNQETYRGACQITVHGSVLDDEESRINALMRETREELGEEFAEIMESKKEDLVEINRIENDKISVVNFAILLSEDDLKTIEMDQSTGGFIKLVSEDKLDTVRELTPSDRLEGVKIDEIAMFPDDKEAVQLAFEKLS